MIANNGGVGDACDDRNLDCAEMGGLPIGTRAAAMVSRSKGGSAPPHAAFFALLRRVAGGSINQQDAENSLKILESPLSRAALKEMLNFFIPLYLDRKLKLISNPRIYVPGRQGVLIFNVTPTLILSSDKEKFYIHIWANKSPSISPKLAKLANLLTRQAVGIVEGMRQRFEFIDLTKEKAYSLEISEADDYYDDFASFSDNLENQYRDKAA